MKHVQSFSAAVLALILVGCGGSSNNSGTSTPVGNTSTVRIEAIVQVQSTNIKDYATNPTRFTAAQLLDPTNQTLKGDLIDPTVFGFQDMTNFQIGEDYVFQLASYDSSGNRTVLPAQFSSSDALGLSGNLAGNSGTFQASNNATSAPVSIYANYNGKSYSGLFQTHTRQARLDGNVTTAAGNPVPGADVLFYDQNGLLVGSVFSAADGTFRASIPIGAQTFTIDPHFLTTGFYGVFQYVPSTTTVTYAAGDADCRAPLPQPLSVGTQPLPGGTPFTITLVPVVKGKPAPGTTGCLGG